MKLATYDDGSRDGQLIVVSRDLSQAHFATGIAGRLQQVLDDWNFLAPQLETLSQQLNQGRLRHAFSFEPGRCLAPLPRSHQHLQGQAYAAHRDHLAAAGVKAPTLQQACSDGFGGAHTPLRVLSEAQQVDVGPGLVVVLGDVAQGVSAEQALEGVRLLGLCNAWALRALDAPQAWLQPAAAFAPVFVTPDELSAHGSAWSRGRVALQLQLMVNGRKQGQCDSALGMSMGFGELIAQAARGRRLCAGTLISAGTVAQDGDDLKSALCLLDRRALEAAADKRGEPKSGYLKFGDSVLVDAKGADGQSVFGALDQDLVSLDDADVRSAQSGDAAQADALVDAIHQVQPPQTSEG